MHLRKGLQGLKFHFADTSESPPKKMTKLEATELNETDLDKLKLFY
jgi:hypothetical protein